MQSARYLSLLMCCTYPSWLHAYIGGTTSSSYGYYKAGKCQSLFLYVGKILHNDRRRGSAKQGDLEPRGLTNDK